MNTEFLKGFLETARAGSIAKASERLHMTHTALGKQLRSLEQQFGVQLFVRSPQGVELTEAGRTMVEAAVPLLEQVEALGEALKPYRQRRRLRIGTVPDLASRFLTAALSGQDGGDFEAELVLRPSTADVYPMLASGEADLLVAEQTAVHPSVWAGVLHREPLLVVMPKEHPFASHDAVSPAELSEQPLVLYAEGCTIRAKVTALLAAAGLPLAIRAEVGFHEVILGFVASGAGLTVLPETAIQQLPSDRFAAVPLDHPDARRTIAVYATDGARGRKLLQFLRQRA